MKEKKKRGFRTAGMFLALFLLFAGITGSFSGCAAGTDVSKETALSAEASSSKQESIDENQSAENKSSTEEQNESAENKSSTEEQNESVENKSSTEEQNDSTENKSSTEEQNESVANESTVVADGSSYKVTFLDVGQGSSALVEADGHFMLIDGGDREYSSFVVSYLKNQGVDTLDYVIVSHYDADHLNGIVGALNAFTVANVIQPDYTEDTKIYQSYVKALETKGINPLIATPGSSYSFQGNTIEILGPVNCNHSDVNDNSVVVRLHHGNNRFLFMGDAEKESEEEILNQGYDISADVIAVGHHGSSSSSSEAFLDKVNPKMAVISCGAGNSYGHPSQKILDRLQSRGIWMYRTDEQGTLEAVSDGANITFSTDASQNFTAPSAKNEVVETEAEQAKENIQDDTEQQDQTVQEEPQSGTKYILNTNTMKFHIPGCSSAKQIKEKNYEEFFGTREEAIAMGYDPCGRCHP